MGNTGLVTVKIDSYMEGESCTRSELLVLVVEVVICGCVEAGDTGELAVEVRSCTGVVAVESCRRTELLVLMVEVVTCECVEVGDTGELAVEVHSCAGIVVVESCSSMEVVKTCGMVLETQCLVEVVEFGSYLEAWTVGKEVVKCGRSVEVETG